METAAVFSRYNSDMSRRIVEMSGPREVPRGYYAAVVKDNTFRQSAKGTWMWETTFKLLERSDDASSALPRDYKLYTWIPNDTHGEKVAVFQFRQIAQFVQAFELDGVIQAPRKIDGTWYFNGSAITPAEFKDALKEANNSAIDVGATMLQAEPALVNDAVIFVHLDWEYDSETKEPKLNPKGYKQDRITWVGANLPDGKFLVDSGEAPF